ncbi:glycosyltransferase [Paludibacter jiangxiensis]|uniref:alpha-1,3-mannosyl-glycoprotein 2-beta-N-acetylglucosaminyltransferase n=1 Tax=Paludibacter jiangxiensis TaxID=681398 RepID=A0A161LUV1_9BACT|nr:glycosyltransferase [Paludibacter jiangxiensis]GAT62869.1 glycosyl transferase family 2 [Paludibacter jiangxiensis]
MKIDNLAPIVLFVYNRPQHTQNTINALINNQLSQESTLYIFADGPKENATQEQIRNIEEVRQIINATRGFKQIVIHESKTNKGLANSVIEGVTKIIDQYERVIVLEDDLVTSPAFLSYMNQALSYYKEYPSVFSISADRPQNIDIPSDYPFDVFVSLRAYSYGWGTWKEKWNKINWNHNAISDIFQNSAIKQAFNRGGEDLTAMLFEQHAGKIDSWAVRFVLNHFIHHCVSIMPCKTYIINNGFDGTGTHCDIRHSNKASEELNHSFTPCFLPVIYEDASIINSFYSAFYPRKRPVYKKIINKIARLLGMSNIFIIKKKVYC